MKLNRIAARRVKLAAVIVAFAALLAVYILPLGVRQLLIPDETRYAEIPREMLASGSWLVPTFNGMPYFEKPSAAYWPVMASMKLLGESRFAVRLPYAMATLLTAMLVFLFLKSLCGNELRGLLRTKDEQWLIPAFGAMAFLSMGEVFGVGTFAVLDPLFALFLTGTMFSFYCAWTERSSLAKQQLFMFVAGLCAGAAFMVKGFLGILLPGGAILAFLIWMRDWRAIWQLPFAGLLGALAIALPWALKQHQAAPDFWRYFIVTEHFGRLAGEGAERHPQALWYYIPVLIGGFMPFTVFAYSLLRGGLKLDWSKPLFRFAAAWAVIPFIALSISSGKLGTYILPLFPALAILALFCLRESFLRFGSRSFDLAAKILAGVLALAGIASIALCILARFGVGKLAFMKDVELGMAVFSACLLFLMAMRLRSFKVKMPVFFLAVALLMACWPMRASKLIEGSKAPEGFIWPLSFSVDSSTKVYANESLAGAVSWSLRRTDIELYRKDGEFSYGLEKSGRKVTSPEEFRALLEASPEKPFALFIPERLLKRFFDDIKQGGDGRMLGSRRVFVEADGNFAFLIFP